MLFIVYVNHRRVDSGNLIKKWRTREENGSKVSAALQMNGRVLVAGDDERARRELRILIQALWRGFDVDELGDIDQLAQVTADRADYTLVVLDWASGVHGPSDLAPFKARLKGVPVVLAVPGGQSLLLLAQAFGVSAVFSKAMPAFQIKSIVERALLVCGRLHRLIYTSQVSDLSVLENSVFFENIVMVSEVQNRRLDISGALLVHNGHFVQALEGSMTSILNLYGSIKRDTRHHSVKLAILEPIGVRRFWRWGLLACPTISPTEAYPFNPPTMSAHDLLLLLKMATFTRPKILTAQ